MNLYNATIAIMRFSILFINIFMILCCSRGPDSSVAWESVLQDKISGSEFDVQERRYFYYLGEDKIYHEGDENQRCRIVFEEKVIANLQDSGNFDFIYQDFWATTEYVYSLKHVYRFDDSDNYIDRSSLVIRIDQQGHEQICLDVSEYQDKTGSLMFSSIINEEVFAFCSWITGDMERIEISINDCSGI